MATDPEIIVREHDQPTRVVASGPVADRGSEHFRGRLDEAVRRHGRVVIDLTRACTVDESTVDALRAHRGSLVALLLPMDGSIDPDVFGRRLGEVVAYQALGDPATDAT